jgi:hypothetical protein
MYTVFFISFVVSCTCFGCYLQPSSGAQLQRTANDERNKELVNIYLHLNKTYMLPICTEPQTSKIF